MSYNNTEDIHRLYRRRGLFSRSVGVQSPTERKQFFELPLLVKSRALKKPEIMHIYFREIPLEECRAKLIYLMYPDTIIQE